MKPDYKYITFFLILNFSTGIMQLIGFKWLINYCLAGYLVGERTDDIYKWVMRK